MPKCPPKHCFRPLWVCSQIFSHIQTIGLNSEGSQIVSRQSSFRQSVMDIDAEVGCSNQNVFKEYHFSCTEEDIWAVIKELKISQNANINIGQLINFFAERCAKVLKYQLKQYKLLKTKWSSSRSVVLSFQIDQNHKQGTKRKWSFTSLTLESRWEQTDSLLPKIEQLVDDENRRCEELIEEKLTTTQILGYLIYCINYTSDKQVSRLRMSIFEGKHQKTKKLSNNEAVVLMHELTLTK